MAEYTSILGIRILTTVIFFSHLHLLIYSPLFVLKTLLLAILFVWIRATLPRIRYDNLISLTWKKFLPFTLATIIILLIFPII
jgi:NADH:ubiquinone oxidoreductase subunit H